MIPNQQRHGPRDGESARGPASSKTGRATFELTIEQLEASDQPRLLELLYRSLETSESASKFADCLQPLCEDPSEEAMQVQDRLCLVVARALRELALGYEAGHLEKLQNISIIVHTILFACEINPRGTCCKGLEQLLSAQVSLLDQLDSDRIKQLDSDGGDNSHQTIRSEWFELYVEGIERLRFGLRLPGYQPSAELLLECRKLVTEQLSSYEEETDSADSITSQEAQLLSVILRLARTVADDSLEEPLISITNRLVEWFKPGDVDRSRGPIPGAMYSQEPNSEYRNTVRWMELAERRAMAALLRAQWQCSVEGLWKKVLETRTLASVAGTIALHGLAKSHAEGTAKYVSKLLNRIGSDTCPPDVASRYLKTLILIAGEPAMREVILEAFSPESKYHVAPSNKALLISRVEERLRIHEKCAEVARHAIEASKEDSQARARIEKSARKQGMIGSKLAWVTLKTLTVW